MPKDKVPVYDLGFWWQCYFFGIVLPVAFMVWGVCSIVTRHSYMICRSQPYFVSIEGTSAALIGVAWIGIALMLFANCFVQYQKRMGFYYQWLLVPGALLTIGGIWSACWISWMTYLR